MYSSKIMADRIKECRLSQKMTQRELAFKAHLTPATISAYENGVKNPSLENVFQLSEALNVSIDWLCGNEVKNTMPKTYSDIISNIIKALECVYYSVETITESQIYDVDVFKSIGYKVIMIHDKTLQKFLFDLQKMVSLLNDNTIDKDIFNSWIDGQLKKYDTPITNIKAKGLKNGEIAFSTPQNKEL